MDDKNNKIQCALVGCGRISSKHIQALKDNSDDFELIAVCDVIEERAKAVAQKEGVPFYVDLKVMLNSVPEIDLVCICTPSGLHPQHSIMASKYDKHVVTEKPMGCNVAESEQMIQVAKENNKILFVVKQNRLNPTVQALKQAIDQGRFGKIYMVQSNVFWMRPQEYYSQAPWRGTWKMDGGAFMNQASHYVDLLGWLVGPIKTLQAMTRTLARNIEAEDSGVVNFEWEHGAIGSMSVTMLTYPKNMEGSITILGEKGTVRLDGVALNEVKIWDFADNQNEDMASLSYQPDTVYGNGHGPYYKNVADVLLRGAEAVANGESGLKSVKLLEAIYESSKNESLMMAKETVKEA